MDAVQTDDPPGTVLQFRGKDIVLKKGDSLSVHQKGMEELFRFLPLLTPAPEVVVIGIVPKDVTTPGTDLTAPVGAALAEATALILHECGSAPVLEH